jgi:site-specific DNA recombinase
LNVAGYVRVSSEEQVENYSIPQQKEMIENYCKVRSWNLIKIYGDGGFTGANTERPALNEFLDNAGAYDAVVVYKIDRFSRSQKDMLNMIEVLKEKGCKFVSIQENFDTSTPLGMAMLGILAAFAQLEREQIKERMSLGRKGRTQKGLWRAGSNVPTGYDYIDGHLVIREDEAVQIRKIFELFLKGWTINAIKEYMHENYTNRYSSWSHNGTITTTLQNSLYIGKLPSKSDGTEYQGEHEPIIDDITFYEAQRLLKFRREHFSDIYNRPFKATHLLSGIAYCSECGGRISVVSAHQYRYYGCHRKSSPDPRKRKVVKCKTPNYRVEVLDQLIIDEVLKLSYDPKAIKQRIRPRKKTDHSKALKTLEKQKARLIDLYSVGGIELEDLTGRIDSITKKILSLKNDKPQDPDLSYTEAVDLFNNAREIFESGTTEEKRSILMALIKKIVITEDSVEIYWRFE